MICLYLLRRYVFAWTLKHEQGVNQLQLGGRMSVKVDILVSVNFVHSRFCCSVLLQQCWCTASGIAHNGGVVLWLGVSTVVHCLLVCSIALNCKCCQALRAVWWLRQCTSQTFLTQIKGWTAGCYWSISQVSTNLYLVVSSLNKLWKQAILEPFPFWNTTFSSFLPHTPPSLSPLPNLSLRLLFKPRLPAGLHR